MKEESDISPSDQVAPEAADRTSAASASGTPDAGGAMDASEPAMTLRSGMRCLLALCCSHAVAPYFSARASIRFQLEGHLETSSVLISIVALVVGAALSWRQLVGQPAARRRLYFGTIIVLWLLVSAALIQLAVDSAISIPLLIVLWSVGTGWVPWLVWAGAFFTWKQIGVGSAFVLGGTILFWSLVEVTGLTGDARVEVAWRDPEVRVSRADLDHPQREVSDAEIVWSGYADNRRNAVRQRIDLADNWEKQPPEELWRVPCGAGWSSFAATASAVFTQEQLNGQDSVTARSMETGELLWVWSEDLPGFTSGLGGDGPRATPHLAVQATDAGQRTLLYAVGPTGLTVCLEARTGELLWRQDLTELFPGENLVHGVSASPLVFEETVLVCPPAPGGPCLAALSADDGRVLWKCDSTWRSSYSSPALFELAGVSQVVLHAGPGVIGVNPQNGAALWQFEWTNEWDNNATQPLQPEGSPTDLIVATGYRGGAVRLHLGVLEETSDFSVSEVWKTTRTMRTKFCNMALFRNVLTGLDNGILCGVDVRTGASLWKSGRYGHGQLLQCGDRLLVLAERGSLHLLEPDDKGPRETAHCDVFHRKTWSHPILVGDRLLVRNDRQIACLRLPLQ